MQRFDIHLPSLDEKRVRNIASLSLLLFYSFSIFAVKCDSVRSHNQAKAQHKWVNLELTGTLFMWMAIIPLLLFVTKKLNRDARADSFFSGDKFYAASCFLLLLGGFLYFVSGPVVGSDQAKPTHAIQIFTLACYLAMIVGVLVADLELETLQNRRTRIIIMASIHIFLTLSQFSLIASMRSTSLSAQERLLGAATFFLWFFLAGALLNRLFGGAESVWISYVLSFFIFLGGVFYFGAHAAGADLKQREHVAAATVVFEDIVRGTYVFSNVLMVVYDLAVDARLEVENSDEHGESFLADHENNTTVITSGFKSIDTHDDDDFDGVNPPPGVSTEVIEEAEPPQNEPEPGTVGNPTTEYDA